MSTNFNRLLIIIVFGGAAIIFVLYNLYLGPEQVISYAQVVAPRIVEEELLPIKDYLDVPYTVQAPYAKWDIYDEESCEEAAFLMVYEYLEGKKYPNGVIPKEEVQEELRKMIDFQINELSYELTTDLFPEEVKTFVESYWPGYTIRTYDDITVDEVKKEIYHKNPVIIPVTAKIIANPWYHYPDYHMLVVVGYDQDEFITNDPGTKKGEDWRYPANLVLRALEDSGSKAIVLMKIE